MMSNEQMPLMTRADMEKVAAARRNELANRYLTGPEVEARLNIDAQTLVLLRRDRQLLGVWHEPANVWLYPDFQFNQAGLIKQVPSLLSVYDRFNSHYWDNTWRIVEWFMCPHALLDGQRPESMLAINPQRVLSVARVEFEQDPRTNW